MTPLKRTGKYEPRASMQELHRTRKLMKPHHREMSQLWLKVGDLMRALEAHHIPDLKAGKVAVFKLRLNGPYEILVEDETPNPQTTYNPLSP